MTTARKPRALKSLESRFWPKVEKKGIDECWLWLGALNGDMGYGAIKSEGKKLPAHKISWEFHHGKPFPAGMNGCHTCDTPRCVNPLHIFPGTQADNMRDASQKNRLTRYCAEKTRCPHGHEYSESNTYIFNGKRNCRICLLRNANAYSARARAARRCA